MGLHKSAKQEIDAIIANQDDWKRDILSNLRTAVTSTSQEINEEVKWKTPSRPEGLPVWSYNGILCIAETWKDNVKLVFFKGAEIDNPGNIFNARLKSGTDRAIEYREGDLVDSDAVSTITYQAMKLNESK